MIAYLWAKVSGWLALIGAVVAAVFAAMLWGEHKGRQMGTVDAAKQAIRDARAAQAVTADVASAVEKVRKQAAKQPPPDVEHRDDFDTRS